MSIFNFGTEILVDIGGSGVRIATYSNGQIGIVRRCNVNSKKELFLEIRKAANGKAVKGIAFAVPGFVDINKRIVLQCHNATYLEGNLADEAQKEFSIKKVKVVNDGEAHVRTLLLRKNVKFGAINLGLGTGVAFGAIDEQRNVIQTLNGGNWDIGEMTMDTRSGHKEVWYLLGTNGLYELETTLDGNPYIHFGYRLATLMSQLAVIFRPRTIGLSGGIVVRHADELRQGVLSTFREPPFTDKTEICFITDSNSAMRGLTTLL